MDSVTAKRFLVLIIFAIYIVVDNTHAICK